MPDLTGYAPQGYYDPVTGPDGEVTDHDDPRTDFECGSCEAFIDLAIAEPGDLYHGPDEDCRAVRTVPDPRTANYIAARASESLSYGDIAYAQDQGWCSSSPDGMGPHRPDDTTDPVTCAECGQDLSDLNMEEPTDD